MSDNKRYYWLQLKEDFFDDDTIQWIEEQENGKDYVLFYLKLCLKSLKTEGKLMRLVGERLIPYDRRALAKLTNTDADTVSVAMDLFAKIGLVQVFDGGEIYLNQIEEMIGSETDKAAKMRRLRAEVNQVKEIAQNSEGHIPYIEEYANRNRYGGNYYNVFNRDKRKCLSCESNQNLCVHHVIGFDEKDKETVRMGAMVTLCRSCHSREHANPHTKVSDEMLKKIGFDFTLYDRIAGITDTHGRTSKSKGEVAGLSEPVTSLPKVTPSLQNVNQSKSIEKEIELEIEKEIEEKKEKTPSEKRLEEDFDSLWQFYPNKKGKAAAKKAYAKAVKEGTTNLEIADGITRYNQYIQKNRISSKYIKHGSTWFAGAGWLDDYEENALQDHRKVGESYGGIEF